MRPYLVAYEQQVARQWRARRRVLLLAVHGIDIGSWVVKANPGHPDYRGHLTRSYRAVAGASL